MQRALSVLLGLFLVLVFPTTAQEMTETPTPEYPFTFPLDHPTPEQIEAAYQCILPDANNEVTPAPTPKAETQTSPVGCDTANRLLALAQARGEDTPPAAKELELFQQLVEENPALPLRLAVIAQYYNAQPLVAPPIFTDEPITKLALQYTFAGLGDSVEYNLTITDANRTPVVSGDIGGNHSEFPSATPSDQTATPLGLVNTVAPEVVQALGPALRDLVPIEQQFSSVPCWDYYPDWHITLTFANKTVIQIVTNESNIVGLGGPWQVEIDGKNYMQYSGALAEAVSNLLDSLNLPLGSTMAMGCGGITDPLFDAFPR